MKYFIRSLAAVSLLISAHTLSIDNVYCQDVADPLGIQGLDQMGIATARSRALGGTVVGTASGSDALFMNPAALMQVQTIELHAGTYNTGKSFSQSQHWIPNRFFADMSLMFENKLDGIPIPEEGATPYATIHKPFDTLTPDWEKNLSKNSPALFSAAAPLTFLGLETVAGIGYAELFNLNHYYQNNNAVNPNLGQYRPQPIPLPKDGDTLHVEWYQFTRERTGKIHGVTPAISVRPVEWLRLGISVAFLSGTSDDAQYRKDRGFLSLLNDNKYALNRVAFVSATSGTSKYFGTLTTLALAVDQEYYAVSVVIRPAYTITRNWNSTTVTDAGGNITTQMTNGTDRLKFPQTYTLGLTLKPNERWMLAVDYDVRAFDRTMYSRGSLPAEYPWVESNSFRVGAEYALTPWLDLRAGAREETQAFQPAGESLVDEPARGTVYSGGFGVQYGPFILDAAYEYGKFDYNDLWQSNVNFNTVRSHTGLIEIGYRFE